MEAAGLLVFCTALFIAAGSPGPGLAAIVARVLGRGPRGAIMFTIGVAFGDVVWLTLAICGLAVLAQSFHVVFLVVKWVGVAYLLYLAWQMWTAPVEARDVAVDTRQESQMTLFLAGLAVTMGNPKVMVFYLALLPTIDPAGSQMQERVKPSPPQRPLAHVLSGVERHFRTRILRCRQAQHGHLVALLHRRLQRACVVHPRRHLGRTGPRHQHVDVLMSDERHAEALRTPHARAPHLFARIE